MQADAESKAAADYDLASFDRIIVVFSQINGFPSGQSDVGLPRIRINGNFDPGTIAHELGHTYGLWHAGLWQVDVGDPPISLFGHNETYGDVFDVMGSGGLPGDPNPYYKYILGWIPDSQVQTIGAGGTYRVSRFDNSAGAGTLALKLTKDGTRSYWMGVRRKFTNNSSMQNGLYVIWGWDPEYCQPDPAYGLSNGSMSDLIDMNTPGNDPTDAAPAVGSVFNDDQLGVAIIPLKSGGTSPYEYMDVAIDSHGVNGTPTWVDFTYSGPQDGSFDRPYNMLETGIAQAPVYGDVLIKGPRASPTRIRINKALRLQAIGGAVRIGS